MRTQKILIDIVTAFDRLIALDEAGKETNRQMILQNRAKNRRTEILILER